MSDSRVDKVITGGDDTFVGYDGDEIDGIISGFEAAGLVVIDPDTVDSDYALSIYESALSREIDEATADIARLAFGDGAR